MQVILPSLFPPLLERVIGQLNRSSQHIRFLVVSPFEPDIIGANIIWIRDDQPAGVNAALKKAMFSPLLNADELTSIICDDAIYFDDFEEKVTANFTSLFPSGSQAGKPFIMGLNCSNRIGTTFGRAYANFPVFIPKSLLDDPFIRENIFPSTIIGAWGDVWLGMAAWYAGGKVLFADESTLIEFKDRLDQPESALRFRFYRQDMIAFINMWYPKIGQNWNVEQLRGFNIDCPREMLTDHTIYIPDPREFEEKHMNCVTPDRN